MQLKRYSQFFSQFSFARRRLNIKLKCSTRVGVPFGSELSRQEGDSSLQVAPLLSVTDRRS
jgi:hypothetical protein